MAGQRSGRVEGRSADVSTTTWRRRLLPVGVQRWGRRAYVDVGRRVPLARVTPDFVLAGGQRCGTTSLFRALEQHPQVVRPTFHKGINYFDLNYHRGPRWYAAHFPTAVAVRRRVPAGRRAVTFEASGYYLFHPLAVPRLAADLPQAVVVVMLRDPVERAFSAWKHESARGFETLGFEDALRSEPERLAGEVERMVADPTYESFAHRHQAYRARGDYLEQLRRVLDVVPREQVHVLYSEDFFARPEEELARLCSTLGIQPHPGTVVERHNARPSADMPAAARADLAAHFATSRAELETLVGHPAPWP